MRDEMIPVKKHQIWFLTEGRGIERELLLTLCQATAWHSRTFTSLLRCLYPAWYTGFTK
jgi:hypothetical protein